MLHRLDKAAIRNPSPGYTAHTYCSGGRRSHQCDNDYSMYIRHKSLFPGTCRPQWALHNRCCHTARRDELEARTANRQMPQRVPLEIGDERAFRTENTVTHFRISTGYSPESRARFADIYFISSQNNQECRFNSAQTMRMTNSAVAHARSVPRLRRRRWTANYVGFASSSIPPPIRALEAQDPSYSTAPIDVPVTHMLSTLQALYGSSSAPISLSVAGRGSPSMSFEIE